MNKRTNILIVVLIALVIGVALVIALTGGTAASACKGNGKPTHYTITIRDGKASKTSLNAKKCDTLTITNDDSETREIAFGPHDHHIAYDGVRDRIVHQSESLTVTLIKTGTYHWHDHLHDELEGNFTVAE
jgi:hypothetical protein